MLQVTSTASANLEHLSASQKIPSRSVPTPTYPRPNAMSKLAKVSAMSDTSLSPPPCPSLSHCNSTASRQVPSAAATMASGSSIDNLASFSAELDTALDSLLVSPIILPPFEPISSSQAPPSHITPSQANIDAVDNDDQDDTSTVKLSLHSRNTSTGSEATLSQAPSYHPVPCMQGAFQESITDAMDSPSPNKVTGRLGPEARRRQVLELEAAEKVAYSSRWEQKPDSKFHPLWKLVAQISFGVHLLHKKIAKSEHEVVKTLQDHVDEVDGFVEDTIADFELAIGDIDERLQALMLPLEHSRTFNRMLCEQTFRQSIVDGNDIIERIIERTTAAMHQSLQDVNEGQDATRELAKFLDRLSWEWAKHDEGLMAIFNAMRSNAQGWLRCFSDLQAKAEHLTKLMSRLSFIVDEVAKRCGIASRRKTPTGSIGRKSYQALQPAYTPNTSTSTPRSSNQFDKPLPAPPRRQKNVAGHIRSPSQPQALAGEPERPALVSASSSQTIDCVRPSPQALSSRSNRPSPSVSDHGHKTSQSPRHEVTRDPLMGKRTVSHQTGMEQLARRYAAGQLAGAVWTPKPPSSSPRVKFTQSSPAVSSPVARPSNTYHEPVRIPVVQKSPKPPPTLTGLGISTSPVVRMQNSASNTNDFTCIDYIASKAPPEPHAAKMPSKSAKECETRASTIGNQNYKLGSFSVFPSTLDPRLCLPRSDDKPVSSKSTPRISTDTRASDKIVVPQPAPNTESTPSSAIDSAYQSSLDTPSLSPSNSHSQLGKVTGSNSVPFGPDDITPYGALRSHPITASMYIPTPSSLLTALPPIRPEGPVDCGANDILRPLGGKKSSMMKKPSMTSVMNLFAKKPAKKEVYHGASGLGGFVEVT